jgi:hypothetical protein
MSSIMVLDTLMNQPGRAVNDAARDYGRNSEAPDAIRAEPVLYGQLARAALLWTGELFKAIRESAGARPAVQPALAVLTGRVISYFEASSRWPTVDHLRDPLRLLIPAYHAVLGMQLLGRQVRPRPLLVEFAEPIGFFEEVLGEEASATIRRHAEHDFRSMPQVVEEGTGALEQPVFRAFLSAGRRRRLTEARTGTARVPAEPVPVEPASSTVQEEADAITAALWTRRLRDTRITLRAENSFEPSYGGGSSYYSAETFLDLFDGGRYRLQDSVTSHVTYSGRTVGSPEPRITEAWGRWSIQVAGPHDSLMLQGDDGSETLYRIGYAGGGSVEIDGEARRWTSL